MGGTMSNDPKDGVVGIDEKKHLIALRGSKVVGGKVVGEELSTAQTEGMETVARTPVT